MVLLRNICDLRPPANGWGNLPSEEDKSLEADIVRIKYFRNTVYALAGQASVNDATFNTHWQNIRAVLVRLGGAKYEDAIDKLKTECMDPVIEEHYKELLQQWKKDEYVIKEQLREMGEDIKYIKEALRVALSKHGEEEVHPEMEHRRQPGSECVTGAPEATGSKGSSPGPSRWTSAQQDQTPGTSSENDPQNEISRERSFLEKGTKGAAICELCGLQGTIICRNCLIIGCIECMEIYVTDLCETTKGQHAFVNLKDKTSGDSKAYYSQESGNTNEASGDGEKDWPCSRCTYLNDPEHRICFVCSATRGIGVVESAKPGSRVCRNCTLHNEETVAVCTACHSPLTKSMTVL